MDDLGGNFIMKGKLTALALLATVVTVGGVYATWTFAEKTSTTASTTVNVAMTGVSSDTEKGTLQVTVMGANGFTLSVDDPYNTHDAAIKKEGIVTVTFKPSATASDDVKTNGINVQCVVSYAPYTGGPATITEWVYDDDTTDGNPTKQIFDITNDESAPILLNSSAATYDSGAGVFKWEIPAADVGIQLANAFHIDTLEEYNALNAELAKGHFVLTVSEYVAP